MKTDNQYQLTHILTSRPPPQPLTEGHAIFLYLSLPTVWCLQVSSVLYPQHPESALTSACLHYCDYCFFQVDVNVSRFPDCGSTSTLCANTTCHLFFQARSKKKKQADGRSFGVCKIKILPDNTVLKKILANTALHVWHSNFFNVRKEWLAVTDVPNWPNPLNINSKQQVRLEKTPIQR